MQGFGGIYLNRRSLVLRCNTRFYVQILVAKVKPYLIFFYFTITSIVLPAQDYLSKLNDTVPNFTLTSIEGKKYSMLELRGRIIVLNFWYTHCPPCVAELPDIVSLEKKHKNDEIIIFALSRDTKEETIRLLSKESITLNNVIVNAQDIHTLFDIRIYPTSVMVDRNGVIRKSCASIPYLERCIDEELQKK